MRILQTGVDPNAESHLPGIKSSCGKQKGQRERETFRGGGARFLRFDAFFFFGWVWAWPRMAPRMAPVR